MTPVGCLVYTLALCANNIKSQKVIHDQLGNIFLLRRAYDRIKYPINVFFLSKMIRRQLVPLFVNVIGRPTCGPTGKKIKIMLLNTALL